MACIYVTARIAEVALDLPWKRYDPVVDIWDCVAAEADEADRAEAARSMVVGWAKSQEGAFYGRHRTDDDGTPILWHGGWFGVWERASDWRSIALMPHHLRDFLQRSGFDTDAILRTWRDRGWIQVGSDRSRLQKRVRLGGDTAWMYVLLRPDEGGEA